MMLMEKLLYVVVMESWLRVPTYCSEAFVIFHPELNYVSDNQVMFSQILMFALRQQVCTLTASQPTRQTHVGAAEGPWRAAGMINAPGSCRGLSCVRFFFFLSSYLGG